MHKIIDSGRKRAVKDTATKKETLRFIKWLKKGKNVLYAIDQDYGIKHSKKINFLGYRPTQLQLLKDCKR